mmetsp:Transcript_4340/g.7414  ORF Transcript_4340/g.7414 Transcript_4340/m.7414 type:complete len:370 (+) Transcript_4340:53-1162(+)
MASHTFGQKRRMDGRPAGGSSNLEKSDLAFAQALQRQLDQEAKAHAAAAAAHETTMGNMAFQASAAAAAAHDMVLGNMAFAHGLHVGLIQRTAAHAAAAAAAASAHELKSEMLATYLQSMEQGEGRSQRFKRLCKEEAKNEETIDGRALLFVNAVLEAHEKQRLQCLPIARDTMFDMTVQMLMKQQELKQRRRNCNASIAYHYTSSNAIASIGTHGLLSEADRSETGVGTTQHGITYGDGVYVGNNPLSFRDLGDTCILCVVLRGKEKLYEGDEDGQSRRHRPDTVLSDRDPIIAEVVLRESCQVVPVYIIKKVALRAAERAAEEAEAFAYDWAGRTRKRSKRANSFELIVQAVQGILDKVVNVKSSAP